MIVLLSAVNACTESKIDNFSFLEGIWKVENKELYESWEKTDSVTLSGSGYKMVNGKKMIHEQLTLTFTDSSVIYAAQVMDQNEGKAIPFTLNSSEKDVISFENPKHDFPQKIQYNQVHADTLLVNVLGSDNKGFSLKLIRVHR
ncbi:MAG: hypothetical protein DWP97_01795 [Calditrichaeota bacterium]|nr:MAG: hypothetical protein DWP97_01795 [Calditrichota bacterium]